MTAKKIVFLSLGLVGVLFAALEVVAVIVARPKEPAGPLPDELLALESKGPVKVEADSAALRKKIQALVPKGYYIVVDSARNVLILKKGDEVVRRAVVSCGSGSVLEEPGGKRKWIFDTPRGEFQVKSKLVAPTWIRPDWAFIEEGKKPPEKSEERLESGVLGDYALGFGEGFFIHGTLYTRLLGRSVTHGCVRVGDDDLKALYQAASLGTRIFIF
jgi:lipoprotein-anchoring transpeptidase ErfK/SrfK